MIEIGPEQRCQCRRPCPSGRYYFRRESCLACGLFIVRSQSELQALREIEVKQLDRERALARPKGEPGKEPTLDLDEEVRRMFPALSGWETQA